MLRAPHPYRISDRELSMLVIVCALVGGAQILGLFVFKPAILLILQAVLFGACAVLGVWSGIELRKRRSGRASAGRESEQ